MMVRESATLVQLREKAESAERRVAETDRQLGELQKQYDSYERKAAVAEARQARVGKMKWLNPVGFSLTVGGASLAALSAASGAGAPAVGAGMVIGLAGVGCFCLSIHRAKQAMDAAMDGVMAHLRKTSLQLDRGILESERQLQVDAARAAREDYEGALVPLQMLEPPATAGIDDRGARVVVGGVAIPKH